MFEIFLQGIGIALLFLIIPFLHYLTGNLILKILAFLVLCVPLSAVSYVLYMLGVENITAKDEAKYILLPVFSATIAFGLFFSINSIKSKKKNTNTPLDKD